MNAPSGAGILPFGILANAQNVELRLPSAVLERRAAAGEDGCLHIERRPCGWAGAGRAGKPNPGPPLASRPRQAKSHRMLVSVSMPSAGIMAPVSFIVGARPVKSRAFESGVGTSRLQERPSGVSHGRTDPVPRNQGDTMRFHGTSSPAELDGDLVDRRFQSFEEAIDMFGLADQRRAHLKCILVGPGRTDKYAIVTHGVDDVQSQGAPACGGHGLGPCRCRKTNRHSAFRA